MLFDTLETPRWILLVYLCIILYMAYDNRQLNKKLKMIKNE